MQSLIEFAPLVVFFGAWALTDIYGATAALMVAMLLLLGWDWLSTRKLPKMHTLSAVLVWVFGAATLILHDPLFIKWKASIYYWLVAVVLVGSIWIGKKTVLERLLGQALPEDLKVERPVWRNASLVAALFHLALGAVNIWVAYTMSERAWVIFKTWIALPVWLVFNMGIVLWIMRGYEPKDTPEQPT
jgi:intracellular septation protein